MELPIQLIDSHINRGAILHSYGFEEIDHGKFFVIIGVSEDTVVGFFYINSNINSRIYTKPEMFALQCPIKASEYPFLKYDSFICASSLVRISKSKLLEHFHRGEATFVGNLLQRDIDMILEAVNASDLFRESIKKKFFSPIVD